MSGSKEDYDKFQAEVLVMSMSKDPMFDRMVEGYVARNPSIFQGQHRDECRRIVGGMMIVLMSKGMSISEREISFPPELIEDATEAWDEAIAEQQKPSGERLNRALDGFIEMIEQRLGRKLTAEEKQRFSGIPAQGPE